ncbi:MAG: cbiX [Planctomycetaceae bacterium]|nr:cbiX [Planctomycetaceae bacterium]
MTQTGIIIVDHGSRLADSNRLIESVAVAFHTQFATEWPIVEPAHMELTEPSIATAYAHCVSRGATNIVVLPYFLGPGKHWTSDIPALTADAANRFPGTTFRIAPTLGLDDLMLELLRKRLVESLSN